MWVVGLFVDVYITTGCFDKSVKTCDDVKIPLEFNNEPISWLKALLDSNGFEAIVGDLEGLIDIVVLLVEKLWQK